jgi:hypothetical protein
MTVRGRDPLGTRGTPGGSAGGTRSLASPPPPPLPGVYLHPLPPTSPAAGCGGMGVPGRAGSPKDPLALRIAGSPDTPPTPSATAHGSTCGQGRCCDCRATSSSPHDADGTSSAPLRAGPGRLGPVPVGPPTAPTPSSTTHGPPCGRGWCRMAGDSLRTVAAPPPPRLQELCLC